MTDWPLEPINLLDTDYADILANSSDPSFEMQLVRFGVDAAEARIKTNFLTLVRQKPETPEEWAALTEAWEVACGYTPNAQDFQLIVELLWESRESGE
ncbi:MAG: hypothetical protein P2A85_29185 (plasmid) [Microcoleus anatoxicus]|uniref:hypothetical protein n=1 Tax=Microcoleus anatoxicus TaxID=2705319 RepID=UPI0036735A53